MAQVVEKKRKNCGQKYGLNVKNTWAKVFAMNASAGVKERMTDEEILKFMNDEFPGRKSALFANPKSVQAVRRKYNLGMLTDGKVPKSSPRYDENGNEANRKSAVGRGKTSERPKGFSGKRTGRNTKAVRVGKVRPARSDKSGRSTHARKAVRKSS